MKSVNFSYLRMQYHFRKEEFWKDIEYEKKKNSKIKAIQWLPMSGGAGPLFIYSEEQLPVDDYVRHREYTWNIPRGKSYAIEDGQETMTQHHLNISDVNDCLGYMRALDVNFYVFLNGDCY